MIPNRTVSERLQFPTLDISLDLHIPGLGVELHEPVPKSPQLVRCERADIAFNLFDSAHSRTYPMILCMASRLREESGCAVKAGLVRALGTNVLLRNGKTVFSDGAMFDASVYRDACRLLL